MISTASRSTICGSALAERPRSHRRWHRLCARAAIILLASLLHFQQAARDQRLHPDEALFLTFARGAAVQGDWLLPGALDKPPLSIYFSAVSMAAIAVTADEGGVLQLGARQGEFAGRLPNALLALLLAALLMRLAQRLYQREAAALIAGLMAAVSPFTLAYGGSAFTDISALFWLVAALALMLEARFARAGLALGLALCCKQQALFLLPLLLALLMLLRARKGDWLRFALAAGGIGSALLLWDAARPETSIFLLAAAHNAPAQLLTPPAAWLPRLGQWLEFGAWLLGPPLATAGIVALGIFAGRGSPSAAGNRREWALGRLFLLCGVIYLLAHTVFSFNLYDRYLLPLLPLLSIPLAGQLARSTRLQPSALGALMLLLGLGGSLTTPLPIGGGGQARPGIVDLAAQLNSKPVATVIYDPWLGWELGYYLGPWHDKRRVYYPDAAALAAGALALKEAGERYFVAPLAQPHAAWLRALAAAGFAISPEYRRAGLALYRLAPPPG